MPQEKPQTNWRAWRIGVLGAAGAHRRPAELAGGAGRRPLPDRQRAADRHPARRRRGRRPDRLRGAGAAPPPPRRGGGTRSRSAPGSAVVGLAGRRARGGVGRVAAEGGVGAPGADVVGARGVTRVPIAARVGFDDTGYRGGGGEAEGDFDVRPCRRRAELARDFDRLGAGDEAGQVSSVRVVIVSRSIGRLPASGWEAGSWAPCAAAGTTPAGASASRAAPPLFRALRNRAAALVRLRWSLLANFEGSTLEDRAGGVDRAPTPTRAALITFLRSRFS